MKDLLHEILSILVAFGIAWKLSFWNFPNDDEKALVGFFLIGLVIYCFIRILSAELDNLDEKRKPKFKKRQLKNYKLKQE